MKVVGLISSYREGRLVQGAIRSLLAAELDDLIVWEGPAGKIPEKIENAPESDFASEERRVYSSRWRSDARKRSSMLEEAKRRHPGDSLWGIWLDGDEVLINGKYLRDRLQAIVWSDEAELERDPQALPTIHWPLRTVEPDGSVAVTTGRLVRLDLIRSYDISVSVVTNSYGVEEGFGNVQEDARIWMETWMRAVDKGHMIAWPPLPGEPHIVHRSNLRHPARRGLRLHKAEADALRQAGKL